jgi:hypothetical protein
MLVVPVIRGSCREGVSEREGVQEVAKVAIIRLFLEFETVNVG